VSIRSRDISFAGSSPDAYDWCRRSSAGASFAGLTVDQFQRRTSVTEYSRPALKKALKAVQTFADLEGLDAHGRSASIRIQG
jgi:histidinol dehydrogenase